MGKETKEDAEVGPETENSKLGRFSAAKFRIFLTLAFLLRLTRGEDAKALSMSVKSEPAVKGLSLRRTRGSKEVTKYG